VTLYCVTLSAPDDWNDHVHLLEDGFCRYRVAQLISAGCVLGTVEIAGGQTGSVQLVAAEDFDYALSEEEIVEIKLTGPGFAYAPVTEGAEAGFAHVCIEGKSVGKVPLVYGETVEKMEEEKRSFLEKLFQRN
jgi:D-alanyl-D-alanine carboxypeptidase